MSTLRTGDAVLVDGAAEAVGTAVIQLAAAAGARTIAVSSDRGGVDGKILLRIPSPTMDRWVS